MTRIVQIFILMLFFGALATPAQGQGFLKRVIKKVQRLFEEDGSLEDYYLYEGHRLVATELSFLIDPDDFREYPFNLMTDLVIGEYDINLKTGEPRSNKSLRQFANQTLPEEDSDKRQTILEVAYEKNRNLNFLFLITALGDFGVSTDYQSYYISTFLKENPGSAQDTVLEKVDRLLAGWRRNYKIPGEQMGVVLDFPRLPGSENLQEHFLEMISELKNKGLKVYVKLPLQTNAPFYSDPDMLAELDRRVDVFLLKSYKEQVPKIVNEGGCRVPVDMEQVEKALEHYLKAAGIPADKLVLEVPNFGISEMEVGGRQIREVAANGKIIDQVQKNRQLHQTVYDSLHPQRSYATWYDKEDGLRYCFEDSTTLAAKINWLADNYQVHGFSTLGIGYNYVGKEKDGRAYFWWPQAQTMGRPGSKIGWMIGGYFFLFASLGYIWSIVNYWEVRNILAKYRYLFWTHIGRFSIFFSIFLLCVNIIPRNTVGLWVCGIIMGFFMLMRLIRRYTSKAKRYTRYKDKF